MNRIDHGPTDVTDASTPKGEEGPSNWAATVQACLEHAADLATANGCTADTFTQAALGAFISKNPALREQLEAMHLAGQLAELRAKGRIGVA
jgi:hypothetical protein